MSRSQGLMENLVKLKHWHFLKLYDHYSHETPYYCTFWHYFSNCLWFSICGLNLIWHWHQFCETQTVNFHSLAQKPYWWHACRFWNKRKSISIMHFYHWVSVTHSCKLFMHAKVPFVYTCVFWGGWNLAKFCNLTKIIIKFDTVLMSTPAEKIAMKTQKCM